MRAAPRLVLGSNLVDSLLEAYPDILFRVRADFGRTEVGGVISAWADQSLTEDPAKHLTQVTTGDRPALVEADANFNGQSTIRFTSSAGSAGDALVSGTWAVARTQPFTMYAAVRTVDTSGQYGFVDSLNTSNRTLLYTLITSGNINLFSSGGEVGSGIAATSTRIVCATVNGASSAIYVNSYTTGTTGTTGASSQITGLTVGSFTGGAVNRLNGNIGEIIINPGADNLAKRTAFMTYMATRYGVTLV
jgi:hypothetical protein